MNKEKLTQNTWFTILLLILFFPVGLYLMWKNKKFSMIGRIIVTAFFSVLIIGSIGDNPDSKTAGNTNQIVSYDDLQDAVTEENILPNQVEEIIKEDTDAPVDEEDSKDETDLPVDEENSKDETVGDETVIATPTPTPTKIDSVKNDTFKYNGKSYKIVEVDGGDLSGHRLPNVAVDIGFGDRIYWALTNEYGQLIYVLADEIILQDDKNEPVNSSGRYYNDEAKVPGVEQDDLDEGHIIADSLGGVSNAYNITPQNSTLNRHGDQAYMEKVIRDAGGCENFVATITYPNTTTQIPSKYKYEYVLKGNKIVDEFDNVNPDEVNAAIEKEEQSNSASTNETDSKEGDLSRVDTNGNGKVTIAEAKAAGYSMPIYSDHWLYQYMDDRDGDGMVGE